MITIKKKMIKDIIEAKNTLLGFESLSSDFEKCLTNSEKNCTVDFIWMCTETEGAYFE